MLIVSGTMQVPPAKADAMKAACTAAAIATRAEKGCFVYAFWQSVEDPGLFRVYEEWEDVDCLKAHGKSDHIAVYRAALAEIGVFGRDIKMFEPGQMTSL